MAAIWLLLPFCSPAVVWGGQLPSAYSRGNSMADSLQVHDALLPDVAPADSVTLHVDTVTVVAWPDVEGENGLGDMRTQRFYDSLHMRSNRSRFWKLLYDMIVVPVSGGVPNEQVVDEADIYSVYDGMRIDSIEFVRYNVFEHARSYLEKGANAVHVVTRQGTIRRDLMFREGDVFDADVVVRSKQLLRSRSYIADADIEVVPVDGEQGAVMVRVITHDNWSISLDGSARGLTGQVEGEIYDANILGLGDRFSYRLSLDWRSMRYEGSMFEYRIPNMFGIFYEATLRAGRSFTERYYGITVNKKFMQPSDYEVGVIAEKVQNAIGVRYDYGDQSVNASYSVRYNNVDVWGGKSWYLRETDNSIYAMARFNNITFQGPPTLYDAANAAGNPITLPVGSGINPYFYDRSVAMASFGFYREHFLTANLIYGYGYDEYIATGYRIGTTFGYSHSAYDSGWYGSIQLCAGGFTPVGYFMGDVAVGTFYDFRGRRPFGSAVTARVDYFTNLLGHGRWKVRQFASFNYLNGWNRSAGFYESVWFTGESGPREIHGSPLGTDRLVASTETVVFTPWQPLGFRIALYGFADVGFLGYDKNVFRNACFATVGLGVRLKNERLVFGTIQLSLFVNFNRFGPTSAEWVKLTSEQRMQTMRYIPSAPQIVDYR